MLCHVLIGNKIFFIRAYNYQSSVTQRDDMSVVGRKYIFRVKYNPNDVLIPHFSFVKSQNHIE